MIKPDVELSAEVATEAAQSLPPTMKVQELADWLRMDVKAVYRAIDRDEIPGVRRIGRAIRIHRDTVVRWFEFRNLDDAVSLDGDVKGEE